LWTAYTLRKTNGTAIIWASKSPSEKSDRFVIIEKGNITNARRCIPTRVLEVIDFLKDLQMPICTHVDVSEKQSSDLSGISNFFYTSPNEAAWKEKAKLDCRVMAVLNWSEDELFSFYVNMGVNGVFLQRLGMKRFNFGDEINEGTEARLYCDCADDNVEQVFIEIPALRRKVFVQKSIIMDIIMAEMAEYGPAPRNIFLSKRQFAEYEGGIAAALTKIGKSAESHQSVFVSANVLSKLVIEPIGTPQQDWRFSWLGNYVVTKVVDFLVKKFFSE
jgi:hypothetical protein